MDTTNEVDDLRHRSRSTGRLVMVLGITLPLALGLGIVIGMLTIVRQHGNGIES